jgi:hypothetical protein
MTLLRSPMRPRWVPYESIPKGIRKDSWPKFLATSSQTSPNNDSRENPFRSHAHRQHTVMSQLDHERAGEEEAELMKNTLPEKQADSVCPVCGGPLISEKCKVVCRSERCRYRIVFNCAEF